MAIHDNISFYDIDGWCAGVKVCGLSSVTVKNLTNKALIDAAFDDDGPAACLVASVNVKEVEVIKWLVENKWTPGPKISNWNHGGRKTLLYFKQVTKARYNR